MLYQSGLSTFPLLKYSRKLYNVYGIHYTRKLWQMFHLSSRAVSNPCFPVINMNELSLTTEKTTWTVAVQLCQTGCRLCFSRKLQLLVYPRWMAVWKLPTACRSVLFRSFSLLLWLPFTERRRKKKKKDHFSRRKRKWKTSTPPTKLKASCSWPLSWHYQ